MSSAILTMIISNLLTFVEGELIVPGLIKNEPEILATLEADLQSLIAKLEALLAAKHPQVAAVVNPILQVAESAS